MDKLNEDDETEKKNLSTIEQMNKRLLMDNDKQKNNNNKYNSFIDRKNSNKKKKAKNKEKEKENSMSNINNEESFIEKLDNFGNKVKLKYSKKIKQMPFLITPIKIYQFHKKNNNKLCFKMMIFICLLFLLLCINFRYFIIYKYDNENNDFKKLSLEKVITNYPLNIFYLLDIELFVLLVNWVFFAFYSKAQKIGDIFDFLNNIRWSFFIKSYFSFIIVSSTLIIYIFYQSETVIKINISNILIYSFINLFFVLIFDIIFYSFFEFPLKKIFKICFNSNYRDFSYFEDDNNTFEEQEEEEEEKEIED